MDKSGAKIKALTNEPNVKSASKSRAVRFNTGSNNPEGEHRACIRPLPPEKSCRTLDPCKVSHFADFASTSGQCCPIVNRALTSLSRKKSSMRNSRSKTQPRRSTVNSKVSNKSKFSTASSRRKSTLNKEKTGTEEAEDASPYFLNCNFYNIKCDPCACQGQRQGSRPQAGVDGNRAPSHGHGTGGGQKGRNGNDTDTSNSTAHLSVDLEGEHRACIQLLPPEKCGICPCNVPNYANFAPISGECCPIVNRALTSSRKKSSTRNSRSRIEPRRSKSNSKVSNKPKFSTASSRKSTLNKEKTGTEETEDSSPYFYNCNFYNIKCDPCACQRQREDSRSQVGVAGKSTSSYPTSYAGPYGVLGKVTNGNDTDTSNSTAQLPDSRSPVGLAGKSSPAKPTVAGGPVVRPAPAPATRGNVTEESSDSTANLSFLELGK